MAGGAPPWEDARWVRLARWARVYAWLTFAGLAFGIAAAHKVLLGAGSWTTCDSAGCVLVYHLVDVPFVLLIAAPALYAVLRLGRATTRRYLAWLTFGNVAQLVFFVFEITVIQDGFRRGAPGGEQLLLAAVAATLLLGAGLGFTLQLAVLELLHPSLDPRYAHPSSERELVALVRRARRAGVKLRVRGSGHSVHAAIATDDPADGSIEVQLDRYTRILGWDVARKRVTVQAGCHLGVDPGNRRSTQANSLLWQLERRGWALPDLGGISHQTVSGFISTGSMGGSTRFDVATAIVGLRVIDGTGQVHDLSPDPADPDDAQKNPFHAAGVSMGLLGVISTVTLQCVDRYDIIGRQDTTRTAEAAIDLFADGALAGFFRETEYSRILWWPQRGVDKVQIWQARRTRAGDEATTHRDGRFEPRPFKSVPGGTLAQRVIKLFYDAVSHDRPPYEPATQEVIRRFLDAFLPVEQKPFWEAWLTGLPMDNQISDVLMPTDFTELFIDIDRGGEVMRELRAFFAGDHDLSRTGAYAIEIYPGARSGLWMSPSHGVDTVRIDVFWFRNPRANPETEFYPQFWNLLAKYDFRPHWGKYLPPARGATGIAYRRAQLPRWDDFLALRERMDPDGVFLTSYWREHLGVGAGSAAARPPLARVA